MRVPAIPWTTLYVVIMVIAVAVCLLVAGLLAYALIRTRRRPDEGLPPQTHGNRTLEILWTASPVALLLVIFLLTTLDMRADETTPGAGLPEGRRPDVIVVGHEWWWEYRYPPGQLHNQPGTIVTANELHLPVNRSVLVQLEASVVQHDFWIPPLGQKFDMYPGKTNHLWLHCKSPSQYW